jgi:phosphate transport system substrate-binding protein
MLADGNEGVAGKIEISEGAIGYVEYGFARRLGLTMAVLQNKSGNYVSPTPEAGIAGLAELANTGRDTMGRSSANPLNPDAYPIIAVSWFLLRTKYPADKEKALLSFVDFALGRGQSYASDLGYLVLPPQVVELAKAVLSKAK